MRTRMPGARYLELIRRHPLRPLRTEREHDTAVRMLDELVVRDDPKADERDYVETLTLLVEDYQRKHHEVELSELSPIEILTHLMQEHEMRPADLGRLLGSRGLVSDVLAGRRSLSKANILKLAARFNVEPGLFLDRASKPVAA